ncbi:uncharacterized protein ASPGLDRAFT_28638 [Aspergillus glaucus CBS 516.65]|uniref:Uncharacterized protein n=1 Tax=Aspergillus glaucus CBS 516.65 TaxID=1160497 RepID=A0A1L9VAP5_ASPGL|nr:hypothetical protein ASPGLDRAFT_28638 [Aspergillus glaucus CBS 516.65]OJJ81001.1 hypothetical protein ASPGLDRAFT_28638 [Aspergillus glaucus CBS 516.65]
MLLYAFLAYLGIAAAETCRITGSGIANCRFCPGNCDIKSTFPPGSSRDIDCLWNRGEEVQGDKFKALGLQWKPRLFCIFGEDWRLQLKRHYSMRSVCSSWLCASELLTMQMNESL